MTTGRLGAAESSDDLRGKPFAYGRPPRLPPPVNFLAGKSIRVGHGRPRIHATEDPTQDQP